jgi:hypothetical protein
MPRNAARHQPAFAAGQASFAASLLTRGGSLPPGITSYSSCQPVRRFNVYRNNVFHSLADTVAARFPVIARLVGEEFLRAAALTFVERHPPRSPALFEYGGGFPAFLETFEPAAHLPYLADVARLEWARNVAYHGASAEPMGNGTLGALAPEVIGDAVLKLHPSCQLVASPYPIVSIWDTNTHDAEVRPIGPQMPGEAALVVRPRLAVLVLKLGPGAPAFIDSVAEGRTLSAATTRAGAADETFSLTDTLAALLSAGAFTGVSVKAAD